MTFHFSDQSFEEEESNNEENSEDELRYDVDKRVLQLALISLSKLILIKMLQLTEAKDILKFFNPAMVAGWSKALVQSQVAFSLLSIPTRDKHLNG